MSHAGREFSNDMDSEDEDLQQAILESIMAARAREASPPPQQQAVADAMDADSAFGSPVHLNSRSPSPLPDQRAERPPSMERDDSNRDAATVLYSHEGQGPARRSASVETIIYQEDGEATGQQGGDTLGEEGRDLRWKVHAVRDKLFRVHRRYRIERDKLSLQTPRLNPARLPVKLPPGDTPTHCPAYKQNLLGIARGIVDKYNERVQFLVQHNVRRMRFESINFDEMFPSAGADPAADNDTESDEDDGDVGASSSSSIRDPAASMAAMAQTGVDNALGRKRAREGQRQDPGPKKPRKVREGLCCICMEDKKIVVSCRSGGHHYCKACLCGYVDTCCKSGNVGLVGNPDVPCCGADCTHRVRVFKSHLSEDGWKAFEAAQVAAVKRQVADEMAAAQAAAAAAADGVERLKAQFDIVLAYGRAAFCPTCHRPGVKEADKCMHIDCIHGCRGNFCYCCGINRETATGGTGGCKCDDPSAFFGRVDHPALKDAQVLPGESEDEALQAEFHLQRTAHFLNAFVNYIGADSWDRLLQAYPNLLRQVVYGRDLTPERIAAARTYPIEHSDLARASVMATISRMMIDISRV